MNLCHKCSKENNENANFCQYCGIKLEHHENKNGILSEDGQIRFDLNKGFNLNLKLIFDLIIAILIVSDTFLLILIDFFNVDPVMTQNIINFDLAVCFVLFCEFMFRLVNTDDKKEFFKDKNNWIAIIAMIPINFFAFRLFRYIRLIKIFPLIYKGFTHFNKFIKKTNLDWSLGVIITAISAGTISFYILEHGVNRNIHNLWDSFCYVMPTVLTTGSSDISPATQGGDVVGMILMITGVVFFGLFTASIASQFVKNSEQDNNDLNKLEISVKNIENEMNEIKKLLKENK